MVSDVDSANVTATLTLSNAAAGALSTGTSGAVTSTYNAGSGVWTASGAIADVNSLLAGVTFNPALNFNANFNIATSISDGVAPAITGSKAMTGTPVNDAPTATNLSAAESYTEDTALNLTDIVVSDVDSASVTATLTLSNVAAGSLSTATSGAVTSTYNAGTGVWTASGALANVNALLAGETFNPAANFNANFNIATSVSDGVAPAITGSKPMTGVAVNDAPVNTVPGAQTATTGANKTIAGISVNDPDLGAAVIQETLSVNNGSLTLSTTTGLTFNSGANGTSAMTFTGTQVNVNAALTNLVYNSGAFTGAATITLASNDLGSTGTGGPLTDSDTISVTVSSSGSSAKAITDLPTLNGSKGFKSAARPAGGVRCPTFANSEVR